jgi:hypothetical protein
MSRLNLMTDQVKNKRGEKMVKEFQEGAFPEDN